MEHAAVVTWMKAFDKSCPQMLLTNRSNGQGGVAKSKFAKFHKFVKKKESKMGVAYITITSDSAQFSEFLHRALVAHGEVVTRVSCHSDRPIWRYPKLYVLSKMYRKLLFNNLSIIWNIKILFCCFLSGESKDDVCKVFGEIAWEEFKKVGLRNFANLWKKGQWKMLSFGTKKWSFEKKHVKTCSGPNYENGRSDSLVRWMFFVRLVMIHMHYEFCSCMCV